MNIKAIILKILKSGTILLLFVFLSSCQNYYQIENRLANNSREENIQINDSFYVNEGEEGEPENSLSEVFTDNSVNSYVLPGRIVIGTPHNIYVYNFETGAIVDLLENVAPSIFGITCNDSDIWFLNTRNLFDESSTAEDDLPDIYYINTDGNELQRISNNDIYEFIIEISDNGKYALYEEDLGNIYDPVDSRYQIILSNIDISEQNVIKNSANSIIGKFSPDSTQVALAVFDNDESVRNLYIYEINSLELAILPARYEFNIQSFDWFPDQTAFLISTNFEDKDMLVRLNIATGEISEIFRSDYHIDEYALSPDGNKILVSIIEYRENSASVYRKLLLVNVESHEFIPIREGGIDPMIGSYLPAWAPDGNNFLYLQDSDKGNQKQISITDSMSLQVIDSIKFDASNTLYLKWISSQ